MEQKVAEKKIIVLKPQLAEKEAEKIVDKKKTSLFGSILHRPSPGEVRVASLELFYEPYFVLSGKLGADFYRKAVHTINVDDVVKEVVIGDGIFRAKSEPRVWKKFKGGMKAGLGMHKSKVDLELEEHVVREDKGKIALNRHGDEVEFPYKITSETVENYPKRVLDEHKKNVRKLEIKLKDAISKLSCKLMKEEKSNVRVVSETLSVNEANEVYAPIYEVRCIGPDNKVAILRINAITKKTL